MTSMPTFRARHFWIFGTKFDETATAPVTKSFEIGGSEFDVGGKVKSKAELTDINFRYGYSFYTFEEDGFRFGPTLAVSYMKFDIELTEVEVHGDGTPAQWDYSEEIPVPTIGMNFEIPYEEFVFSGNLGAFYFQADDFEGTGIRSNLSATWRPYEHVGFYTGFNLFYADLELNSEDINDLVIYGPTAGIEIRF